jgi:HEAT repeat protein
MKARKYLFTILIVELIFSLFATTSLVDAQTQSLEELKQDLNSDNWQKRHNAAIELGSRKDPAAIQPLIEALSTEEKYAVRERIIEALGLIKDSSAVPTIINSLLNDEHEFVRQVAANALGYMLDTRAIEPLKQALNDSSDLVRQSAKKALEKFGYEDSETPEPTTLEQTTPESTEPEPTEPTTTSEAPFVTTEVAIIVAVVVAVVIGIVAYWALKKQK